MDRPSLIVAATPIMTLIALFTASPCRSSRPAVPAAATPWGAAGRNPAVMAPCPPDTCTSPAPATGKTPSGGWCGCWAAAATRTSPREIG